MHKMLLAATALTAGLMCSAATAQLVPQTTPAWQDCYDLAWIRGVHTEQAELPDFMEQCLAGSVPFGATFRRFYGRDPRSSSFLNAEARASEDE